MTKQESDQIADGFQKVTRITDSLWRRSLQNKAWISALKEAIIPLIAKQSGKSQKEASLALLASMKAAYQKEMETLEKLDPALAAQLDTRSIEEV